jgi:hypothetical protein
VQQVRALDLGEKIRQLATPHRQHLASIRQLGQHAGRGLMFRLAGQPDGRSFK